ncbi:four-carbon acid sugar kinase family protein [Paramicrobacterium chengjingii]|uniref:Four-carbon acid sugar kinase family protein n=1 Tax=Paramicrobacterium chengjingii TaxID=2769067 RepID=A0ABX6YI88_9MICO|nr:four-carbon acid sugar kinase family protein [Microbacterium chengjingii]QPZ38314.1 hypothetical protein HCR76_16250 [Microbacterium chengjingii]
MKTVVLDDDPTGTQSASGVKVLLHSDADLIMEALRDADSVYVQTNTRAIDEQSAVDLVAKVKADAEEAAGRLGEQLQFVLRGDSTLRGHVFAETEVFLDKDAVMLFVPAFPAGGRTTVDGVHFVRVGGKEVPAHETEYARDPVFPFATGVLAEYVLEKSGRSALPLSREIVRSDRLAQVLEAAEPGSVVIPDAENDNDINLIAEAVVAARGEGKRIVVRSASPLAAALAGVASDGLLPVPLVAASRRTLLVCGSHTEGATAQLALVRDMWGEPITVLTDAALDDPATAGTDAADGIRSQLDERPFAYLTTERQRQESHGTLEHGERVMSGLTHAVRAVLSQVDVIIAKGGITSAEVARTGIGARSALVLGQVLPGISVWCMTDHTGREVLYIVVPGNVGDERTLTDVLAALSLP